jgi:hypothetical protein
MVCLVFAQDCLNKFWLANILVKLFLVNKLVYASLDLAMEKTWHLF